MPVSYEEFVEAVATLDLLSDGRRWVMPVHPHYLALLRCIFTEKEIENIFYGEGPGWIKYLDLVGEL